MTEKYIFTVAWLASIAIALCFSLGVARRKWKTEAAHEIGDLITDLFWVENLWTYVALVVCSFFSLPCTLTDIVIALHPWKDIQAYAAVKVEGSRAYTIGYFSEQEYRVKRR